MLELGDCKLVQNDYGEAARWYQAATAVNTAQMIQVKEQGYLKLGELAFYEG